MCVETEGNLLGGGGGPGGVLTKKSWRDEDHLVKQWQRLHVFPLMLGDEWEQLARLWGAGLGQFDIYNAWWGVGLMCGSSCDAGGGSEGQTSWMSLFMWPSAARRLDIHSLTVTPLEWLHEI